MVRNTTQRDDSACASEAQIGGGVVDSDASQSAFRKCPGDVQEVACAAHVNGYPLSVRSSRSDWLRAETGVEIDAPARIATVAGGATAGDVIAAAAPCGLVAVAGMTAAAGITR